MIVYQYVHFVSSPPYGRYDCHPAIPDVTEKLPLYYACANSCVECVKAITEPCKGLKVCVYVSM